MSLPTDQHFVEETLTLLSQATEKLAAVTRILDSANKRRWSNQRKIDECRKLLGLTARRKYQKRIL